MSPLTPGSILRTPLLNTFPRSALKRFQFQPGYFGSVASSGTSRELTRLLKASTRASAARERSGKELRDFAVQMSKWGDSTCDDAVSDVADKIGVLISEMGELELAEGVAGSDSLVKGILKQIRSTEAGVLRARAHRIKLSTEIARLRVRGCSTQADVEKIEQLEQEYVRAEAESLVAEAQLFNMTRRKLKEACLVQFDAVITRCEKSLILARHAIEILDLLDDTPVLPGEDRPKYAGEGRGRRILSEVDRQLTEWHQDRNSADLAIGGQHIGNVSVTNSAHQGVNARRDDENDGGDGSRSFSPSAHSRDRGDGPDESICAAAAAAAISFPGNR
ncbi:Eisosome component PIL1-domain-containing protein [Dipodascopsis tothii]|uniref:Eisosome component PIL1-domain-containing protein n=1 Tax=Dipodascopsis tothii TaxID=44089 RepID=UPI0034CDEE39